MADSQNNIADIHDCAVEGKQYWTYGVLKWPARHQNMQADRKMGRQMDRQSESQIQVDRQTVYVYIPKQIIMVLAKSSSADLTLSLSKVTFSQPLKINVL